MAAVLACAPGAALSHGSAAALWGIGPEAGHWIDVSVSRRCNHRPPGIRARARPALCAEDVTERHGIPVTTPIGTMIDRATELTLNRLERMVNEADKHDVIDPETLRDALEVLFRPIAAKAGLPTPLTKAMVNNYEVDFHWPDLGLVVETDGWHYHRTPSAQTRDALRDQTHTASGLTTLRFSHYQVA
jgi:hypothetical protein